MQSHPLARHPLTRHALTRHPLALTLGACLAVPSLAAAADLMSFWDTPRHGANSFNAAPPDRAYFDALAATGAAWVRLTFSKWDGEGRDFLIGNADDYDGIPAADLAVLRATLDAAHQAGLKVVIVPLGLPGARGTQQNGDAFDDRLWSDRAFRDQSVRFWSDLASALADHPAVAGYNILNEPAPERTQDLAENGTIEANAAFVARQEGTARDLPGFYAEVVAAIRAVDPVTPIMVDGGYFANPRNLAAWLIPLADERILYAFHMYEPYQATSSPNRHREVPLRYPGVTTPYDGGELTWDAAAVRTHVEAAFAWADEHGLPPTRIVAGEFGCIRTWEDCGTYLTDVMDAVDGFGGHWAFYAFREDGWEGMDYELPASLLPGRFYWLMEQGQGDELPRDGALMELIEQRMVP